MPIISEHDHDHDVELLKRVFKVWSTNLLEHGVTATMSFTRHRRSLWCPTTSWGPKISAESEKQNTALIYASGRIDGLPYSHASLWRNALADNAMRAAWQSENGLHFKVLDPMRWVDPETNKMYEHVAEEIGGWQHCYILDWFDILVCDGMILNPLQYPNLTRVKSPDFWRPVIAPGRGIGSLTEIGMMAGLNKPVVSMQLSIADARLHEIRTEFLKGCDDDYEVEQFLAERSEENDTPMWDSWGTSSAHPFLSMPVSTKIKGVLMETRHDASWSEPYNNFIYRAWSSVTKYALQSMRAALTPTGYISYDAGLRAPFGVDYHKRTPNSWRKIILSDFKLNAERGTV